MSAIEGRLGRMAERVAGRFNFPRDFYLPHGESAVNLKKLNPEGTDVEAYTYEDANGHFYGIAFAGKANKPLWHYRFRNEMDRARRIQETVDSRKSHAEFMEKRRQERLEYRHGLKLGDVLVSSWGYDQTNVDFYEVTAVGEKSVKIREIGGKIVPGRDSDFTSEYVMPVTGSFKGPEMTKMVGRGDSVRITSYAWARKWSGGPVRQTAAGFGH